MPPNSTYTPGSSAQASSNEPTALIEIEVTRLLKIQEVIVRLGLITDLDTLADELAALITELIDQRRVMLALLSDERKNEDTDLSGLTASPTATEEFVPTGRRLQTISIHEDELPPALSPWLDGESVIFSSASLPDSPVSEIIQSAGFERAYGIPLRVKTNLIGAVLIEYDDGFPQDETTRDMLQLIGRSAAVIIQNARLHSNTVQELADRMHEMRIMQQIDTELNDTIALRRVFNMTLDWALRFTNAKVASIALYDERTDTLRTTFQYGYKISEEELEALRSQVNSITRRVARSGKAEIISDVTSDKDYVPIAGNFLSQMSVPVLREDRVIAVITLESTKLDAFNRRHFKFVKDLANRAAVAIDNARLYADSVREREKLSYILSNIADVIIVINEDERILLMSQSATSALRLYSDVDLIGKRFDEAVNFSPMVELFRRARELNESTTDELTLPNDRAFFTKISQHKGIGWIIVMQDVTPYKEMDRLKSELISTVSHDLKQPLSVMRGYLDLLQMKNQFSEQSRGFVEMIERSIQNMRQLIDDLLDLAKIESGIELNFAPVSLRDVLRDCIENNRQIAVVNSMTMVAEIPEEPLFVEGEAPRLTQIFNNLISNAIKYTPPEGVVSVSAEDRGMTIRITVQDTGLGVAPEDQAHIFERFFRVRRPETESIEGTGLGLAIVKSLVEAHRGKIRLESKLGEGSSFFVTLPKSDSSA